MVTWHADFHVLVPGPLATDYRERRRRLVPPRRSWSQSLKVRGTPDSRRRWFATLGLLLALPAAVAGCVAVPVRMSPQVEGPSGVSADHTFIRLGQTSRQEVLQRLGWADVGLNDNRIFWGRWRESSSGTVMVVVVPGAVGGERQRNWSLKNLMVEFDEREVALRVEKMEDKNVVRELVAWSRRSGYRPANPSSIRNSFAAHATRGTWSHGLERYFGLMHVSTDSLEFVDGRSAPFKVPQGRIASLKLEEYTGPTPSFTLKLKDKTPWGKEIQLGIRSAELIPILGYITPKNP